MRNSGNGAARAEVRARAGTRAEAEAGQAHREALPGAKAIAAYCAALQRDTVTMAIQEDALLQGSKFVDAVRANPEGLRAYVRKFLRDHPYDDCPSAQLLQLKAA